MVKTIATDKPIHSVEEDRFNRYNFAKRIADTIIESENKDSFVIGIFGAWGEGKTSVINFIQSVLNKSENLITIRFNPWRYTDEGTLLISFFNTLASELKLALNPPIVKNKKGFFLSFKKGWQSLKKPLQTDGELLGELINKYGKIVSVIGSKAGDIVESIGQTLDDSDIDVLKNRLEKLLLESNKKIAVFIDDIDRLDKQEIQQVFRLVKLTADFPFTVYILSFDQDMVASAIGDQFGSGNQDAGFNFLEKIIQIPLKIPVAQGSALKKYCFELVDKAILENELVISENEVRRFVSNFSESILIRLKTPRLAVRYYNTITFSIPLLKGEVNMVDLLLFEALKIFYSDYYEFVKRNPKFFVAPYLNNLTLEFLNDNSRKTEIKENFEKLDFGLTNHEKESIKSLLLSLFPYFREALDQRSQSIDSKQLFRNKHIGSADYFNRYFTYCVLPGEISDISFEAFLEGALTNSQDKIVTELGDFITKSSIEKVLSKFRSREEDINWELSKKLIMSISQIGELLPESTTGFKYGFNEPLAQTAMLIYHLLKKHQLESDCFDIAKKIMIEAKPINFAYEINNWLRTEEADKKQIFTIEQYFELSRLLKDRALKESNGVPIFEKFSGFITYIFSNWKVSDPESLDKYIKGILGTNPEKIITLIDSFTPTMISSNYPKPYKSNFSKEQYNFFTSIFDKEYIHDLIITNYKSQLEEEPVSFPDFRDTQTNMNILRQFIYWFDKGE